jgi:glutamate--cysteine ligase
MNTMHTDEASAVLQAARRVHGICLKNGPPSQVGVELEWLTHDARDPSLPVPADLISALIPAAATAVAEAGGQSALTAEPGGQLELSSAPAPSLADCVAATAADLAATREAAAAYGLTLTGYGLDPIRPPRRVLDLPRYAAMEAFFDHGGPWGRRMMGSSASIQVCLDAGLESSDGTDGIRWRWRLAHQLGPVLVAAFANSPLREGKPTGWRSSRQQNWLNLDPGRTRPVLDPGEPDGDPRTAWAAYALAARVLCVPSDDSPDWTAPYGLTLRDWLRTDSPRPARTTDIEYHLTTLFPPVRPHGYLELRMIDAQPGDGWIVPLAVTAALFDDETASRAAMAAVRDGVDGADPWESAARLGPADRRLSWASRECFAAAIDALDRADTPIAIRDAVGEFHERYVRKDQCPADDLLKEIS